MICPMASSNSLLRCLFIFKNQTQKLVKMVWQIGHEKMLCKSEFLKKTQKLAKNGVGFNHPWEEKQGRDCSKKGEENREIPS